MKVYSWVNQVDVNMATLTCWEYYRIKKLISYVSCVYKYLVSTSPVFCKGDTSGLIGSSSVCIASFTDQMTISKASLALFSVSQCRGDFVRDNIALEFGLF